MGSHQTSPQTGWDSSPRPNPYHTGEMDSILFFTWHIVAALKFWVKLKYGDHAQLLRDFRADIWRQKNHNTVKALAAMSGVLPPTYSHRLQQGQKTVAWISVMPSTINGMDLRDQECRDNIFLRYSIKPTDLSQNCDGYSAWLFIFHAWDCKKVGLVTSCHNELQDVVAHLIRNPLIPIHMSNDPLILKYIFIGKKLYWQR